MTPGAILLLLLAATPAAPPGAPAVTFLVCTEGVSKVDPTLTTARPK